jgi:NADH:ubiquinone oxidoreductase 49 kD subunit 7
MGWDIPPRGKSNPHDLLRNIAHFLASPGIGAMALDLGAMTVFLYTFMSAKTL